MAIIKADVQVYTHLAHTNMYKCLYVYARGFRYIYMCVNIYVKNTQQAAVETAPGGLVEECLPGMREVVGLIPGRVIDFKNGT